MHKAKAWLGVSKVAIEKIHNITLAKNNYSFNTYETINPIIIPYVFNHKY
jgi:hypothetical protein